MFCDFCECNFMESHMTCLFYIWVCIILFWGLNISLAYEMCITLLKIYTNSFGKMLYIFKYLISPLSNYFFITNFTQINLRGLLDPHSSSKWYQVTNNFKKFIILKEKPKRIVREHKKPSTSFNIFHITTTGTWKTLVTQPTK